MKTVLQVAAAILPLLAVPADAGCNTQMGSKAVGHVPTTTTTITASLRPSVTISTRSTATRYTAAVFTYTSITTKTDRTTDLAVTDTFTSTSTEMETDTEVIESTITTTSTSTETFSTTSTTNVPMTQGFRNIQDTLNADVILRRVANPHGGSSPAKRAAKQGALALAYPTKVICTVIKPNTNTKTIVSTLSPTTKTIPYWGRRTTSVSTITSTSTIVPDNVSVTETETETDTLTVSSTTFVTEEKATVTTATALMHGPTNFAACNNKNYFGPNFQHKTDGVTKRYFVNNVNNNGPGIGANYQILSSGASSMADCCHSCMKMGICENFMYRPKTNNCFLLYHDGSTCSSQKIHPNFFTSESGIDVGAGFQVGNGLCGFAWSGNTDGTVWRVDDY